MTDALDPSMTPLTSAEIVHTTSGYAWTYFDGSTQHVEGGDQVDVVFRSLLGYHSTLHPDHRLAVVLSPAVVAELVNDAPVV